jgi:hypothetical protein
MALLHQAISFAATPPTRNALVAGALDFAFATSFWAFRGVAPQRVWQGVVAGLLGRSSFDGGTATARLGVALHYLIAMTMSLAYALPARRLTRIAASSVAVRRDLRPAAVRRDDLCRRSPLGRARRRCGKSALGRMQRARPCGAGGLALCLRRTSRLSGTRPCAPFEGAGQRHA